MYAVRKLLFLAALPAALAACHRAPPEQNMSTQNDAATSTEIEALPPDESDATPSKELANGDDEASNVDQATNTY
jgi:hypothetical protein